MTGFPSEFPELDPHGRPNDPVFDALQEIEDSEDGESIRVVPANDVLLTTTATVPGTEIVTTYSAITVVRVASPSIVKDIKAEVTDIFGGRSKAVEKVLNEAEKHCRHELQEKAGRRGANAVVNVRIEIGDLQSGRLVFVAMYGTPVDIDFPDALDDE